MGDEPGRVRLKNLGGSGGGGEGEGEDAEGEFPALLGKDGLGLGQFQQGDFAVAQNETVAVKIRMAI